MMRYVIQYGRAAPISPRRGGIAPTISGLARRGKASIATVMDDDQDDDWTLDFDNGGRDGATPVEGVE